MLSHPRFASVCALLALVVALGGTSYAAGKLPRGSVGTLQLKQGAVTTAKVKDGAITGAKVRNGSISRADLAPGTLPTTPIVGDLPSGRTQQGYVETIGNNVASGITGTSVSFAHPLPADIGPANVHVIEPGDALPTGCTGTAADPGAARGHLCVFRLEKSNTVSYNVSAPAGDGQASRFGFSWFLVTQSAGFAYVNASWAVTAP